MVRYLLALILGFSTTFMAVGQKSEGTITSKLSATLEGYEDLSGNILITKGDRILFRRSYGLSNRQSKKKNRNTTLFKIGSLTKQFTAALILKLCQQGKLGLDDKLSYYIATTKFDHPVTIRQLLQNTSGIPNYYFFDDYPTFKKEMHSKEEMLNSILTTKLRFKPGAKFEYSNSGYYLLGLIIEKVTKMTFREAIAAYIAIPMDLRSTKYADHHLHLAKGYKKDEGKLVLADSIALVVPFSAGGMIATTENLDRWQKKLFSSFLRKELLKEMTTPGLDNYGFGFWITVSKLGRKIWHTGGIDGFRSMMSYYPEKDIRIVILTNREGYKVKQLEATILATLLANKV
ncbi:MAG: serine hydrolase domain-containing protein [Bacteroidota bacterium]